MNKYSFLPQVWTEGKENPFEYIVGKGWWSILENLCQKIQDLENKNPAAYQTLRVMQIKEKYGTLRFYLNWETEEISALVQEAEKQSAKTCEFCGKTGKLRTDRGWLLTLCNTCNKTT